MTDTTRTHDVRETLNTVNGAFYVTDDHDTVRGRHFHVRGDSSIHSDMEAHIEDNTAYTVIESRRTDNESFLIEMNREN